MKIVGCWEKANRARLLYTACVSGQQSTNKTNKVFCCILGPLGTTLSGEHNHSRPSESFLLAGAKMRVILIQITFVGLGLKWMDDQIVVMPLD